MEGPFSIGFAIENAEFEEGAPAQDRGLSGGAILTEGGAAPRRLGAGDGLIVRRRVQGRL